jgi:hypothetical protein
VYPITTIGMLGAAAPLVSPSAPSATPPAPGCVQQPDGSWVCPSVAPSTSFVSTLTGNPIPLAVGAAIGLLVGYFAFGKKR